MLEISIRSDIKRLEKSLNDLAYKQLPFASATAMTALAKQVKQAEVQNMSKVLDNPTPFTLRSVGVKPARKDTQEALVYVKDIAAEYLLPYEFGGLNKLNSKALLKPIEQSVNKYGNLPRNLLARLKSRSDVFIGAVTFKKTGQTVNGVWQRNPVSRGTRRAGGYGTKGAHSVIDGAQSTLKLLIRFTDAHPVTQHLGWRTLAQTIVRTRSNAEMGRALAKAIRTAR